MIFGITGTNGGGKGTVVDYLRDEKGFTHYSVRDLIIEEVTKRGLPVNRIHIGDTGTALRREEEPAYFVNTFIDRAQETGAENIVIESIRTVAEARRIQELGGKIIAVDAPVELRYERITERGSATDHVTFEQFREQEDREYTAKDDSDPTQMSVLKVMDIADYVLINDGSLEELHKKIEEIL
ncbi:MAG: hypothetical protein JWL75_209 [Parcubacteria group bacterium]|nr:hypothetical protein [Parcubacteria group bacterium]